RATHLKGSTISVALAKLESKGYVKRIADEYDQRQIKVYLTKEGVDLNLRRARLIEELEAVAFKGITPKEEKNTAFVLETMIKNLTEK
ncbi:MAG: winged helix DNA-binding protein, partial [Clostridia bacterium]|nr:winged helix DNA-binding protein [Clostridia bacterium]